MAFLIGKRRYKCTFCILRSELNPKNKAHQWCLGLDSGDSGYVFGVKWFERHPWVVILKFSKYICDDLALETFWKIFSQKRTGLGPYAKIWISPKTIEHISELSDPQTFAAGFHHFQNSGRTARCLIEI